MMRTIKALLRSFRQGEAGTATVEFVLVVPVFLTLFVMSIEIGMITLRHTLLERGLDITVREIRLSTGQTWDHDEIKDLVCENAIIIRECQNNLRLEMQPADPRVFNALNDSVQCTDRAEEAEPVFNIQPGQQNELMLLRACLRYDPLFPEALLGTLVVDATGQAALVSSTAFVQEPL